MELTENLNLKKPAQTDFYNVDDFNDNFDIIDEKLKEYATKSTRLITLEELNTSTDDLEGFIENNTAVAIGLPDMYWSVWSHYNGENRTQLFISIAGHGLLYIRIMSGDSVVYIGKPVFDYLPLTGGTLMGDLTIDMLNYPIFWLKNRTAKNEAYMQLGDTGLLVIGNRDENVSGNGVAISLDNNPTSVRDFVGILHSADGVQKSYLLFGEHNVELVKQKVFAEVPASLV